MTNPTVAELISLYRLQPHPEGGFFNETYRSIGVYKGLLAPFKGERSYSTAIVFLIPKNVTSALHRIASDEVWHFYLGGPLTLIQITPQGQVETITLGADVLKGQLLQHVVPAGHWFGACSVDGSDYSFVGCTVSPGFDFADFEMGKREDLLRMFPGAKNFIERFTEVKGFTD